MILKKNLSNIFIILFSVLFIFNNPQIIVPQKLEEQREENKKEALNRSVLISTATSSWSGVIFERNQNRTLILTIVHEESMRKISENSDITTSFNDGGNYASKIVAWDDCNEVALIEVKNFNTLSQLKKIEIDYNEQNYSERLFSFGHPLGLNVHYSEGFLSSKNNSLKDCGMITNGYSGGVIPGQTGSGVWNDRGQLSGLIVATSAYPIKVYGESGKVNGVSTIPVTFLGRYIPASTIKSFLLKNKSI